MSTRDSPVVKSQNPVISLFSRPVHSGPFYHMIQKGGFFDAVVYVIQTSSSKSIATD